MPRSICQPQRNNEIMTIMSSWHNQNKALQQCVTTLRSELQDKKKKKNSEALASAEINAATKDFFKDGNYFSLPDLFSYILPFLYIFCLQWQLNLHVFFYRTM